MASQEQLAAALANLDSAFAGRAKPVSAPLSREQAAAIRADLDAKFRQGVTVQARDNRGCFLPGVTVATFGGAPVAVEAADELPAFKIAAE
jgi:C-terminal processing protease CtpA/Prc